MRRKERLEILRKIHFWARRLGLSEDLRREYMDQLVGKRSCRDCTDAELRYVLDWIGYRLGFRRTRPSLHPDDATPAMIGYLEHYRRLGPPAGWNICPLDSTRWLSRILGREVNELSSISRKEAGKLIKACRAIYEEDFETSKGLPRTEEVRRGRNAETSG
jgi:hypothetical protein